MKGRNMLTAIRPLLDDLKPQRYSSRVLYVFGGFWIFSALVHTGLLAATGFEWSGSVSWRKPIVFGLSIGLLLMTVGWILDRLPDRPRLAGTIAWTLGVSSTIEVGLITVQAWRGEASHFNVFEETNATIFALLEAMVGIMSLCLFAVLIWATPDCRLAGDARDRRASGREQTRTRSGHRTTRACRLRDRYERCFA